MFFTTRYRTAACWLATPVLHAYAVPSLFVRSTFLDFLLCAASVATFDTHPSTELVSVVAGAAVDGAAAPLRLLVGVEEERTRTAHELPGTVTVATVLVGIPLDAVLLIRQRDESSLFDGLRVCEVAEVIREFF